MVEAYIPIVQVIGPNRNRHLKLAKGEDTVEALSERSSRVTSGWSRTGQMHSYPTREITRRMDVSHLPKVARGVVAVLGDEGKPDYAAALKRKTTVKNVKTNRGKPEYRQDKTLGMGSPHEQEKIRQLRAKRDERVLVADVIDLDQLYLILEGERVPRFDEPVAVDNPKKGLADQFILAHGGDLSYKPDKNLHISAKMTHFETVNVYTYAE